MRIEPMKNRRTDFHIGIGFDRYGKPILWEDRIGYAQAAMAVLVRHYGGCSMTDQSGAWTDPEGTVIIEPGITMTAYGALPIGRPVDANGIALALATIFRQRAVIVAEYDNVNGLDVRTVYDE